VVFEFATQVDATEDAIISSVEGILAKESALGIRNGIIESKKVVSVKEFFSIDLGEDDFSIDLSAGKVSSVKYLNTFY